MTLPVYLDSCATTPCDPVVVESMIPFFTRDFGNPASRYHVYGWEAEDAVEGARSQIARLIGARPSEIIFTSGATESCNLAIKGIFESSNRYPHHIITIRTEHKAVLEPVRNLMQKGFRVSELKVNKSGMPDLHELEDTIRPDTELIAAMYANNETGVILPVKEIALIAKRHNVLFFSDATQAVGKIPVDVRDEAIDVMAFTAHKMYGPKGIGALYIRSRKPSIRLQAQLTGGFHERGLRSGTLNVPGIVGFGRAALLSQFELERDILRLTDQRIKLEKALLAIPGVYLNGDPVNRLAHITNVSIEHIVSEQLLLHLSSRLALSSGAACSSITQEPSHVLRAMGVSGDLLQGNLRISQGRYTTGEQIDFAIEELKKSIVALRSEFSETTNIPRRPSSFSALSG